MLNQLKGDGFTGEFRWIEVPQWAALGEVGAMYYPSPAAKDFAFSRNTMEAMAASLATPPGVRALMWLWKFGMVKSVPG